MSMIGLTDGTSLNGMIHQGDKNVVEQSRSLVT